MSHTVWHSILVNLDVTYCMTLNFGKFGCHILYNTQFWKIWKSPYMTLNLEKCRCQIIYDTQFREEEKWLSHNVWHSILKTIVCHNDTQFWKIWMSHTMKLNLENFRCQILYHTQFFKGMSYSQGNHSSI